MRIDHATEKAHGKSRRMDQDIDDLPWQLLRDNETAYGVTAKGYVSGIARVDDLVVRQTCRKLVTERMSGRAILDAGCGPGFESDYFVGHGLEVTAVDSCAAFVAMTQSRAPAVKGLKMDIADLRFADASFDAIYSYASFHHIPRALAQPTLDGFFRVLRPGGVLVACLLRSEKYVEYTVQNWGQVENNPVHFFYYSAPELEHFLVHAGFSNIEFFDVTCPAYTSAPMLRDRQASVFQVAARRT